MFVLLVQNILWNKFLTEDSRADTEKNLFVHFMLSILNRQRKTNTMQG